MKYYIGSAKWLYFMLQKHYFNCFQSYAGIIPEQQFIEKIEKGSAFQFTFRIYATSLKSIENIEKEINFQNDIS